MSWLYSSHNKREWNKCVIKNAPVQNIEIKTKIRLKTPPKITRTLTIYLNNHTYKMKLKE